jgi:hypothetical protein
MFDHETLESYYSMNFRLKHHHGYGFDEIERLYPFERDVYVAMLIAHQRKLKQQQANQQGK